MSYVSSNRPKKRSNFKKYIIIVFLIVFLIAGVAAYLVFFRPSKSGTAPKEAANYQKEVLDKQSVEAKYLFSGTIVPARAVENEARKSDGTIDYQQPFSQLDTFNPSQYDAWTVDMECPVTDANIPYRQQVENTVFNCRPEFLPTMSKYFTHFNLANNHVYDMGKDKFPQMQKFVQDAGIQYLGNQDPAVKDDVCEVMAMNVKVIKKDGGSEKGVLPMAYCAWHYFERDPLPGEFDVMKQYADIMPVIGLMQVGVEYVAQAGADQMSVGRSIIDGGAEFVIGNSPHWVQNSDVYKDKLIFYSTGNFIFDQLDTETNRGASVEASMKIDYDANVAKWLALGESCKAHQDDCLQAAKEQKLNKVNPKFTFNLVASTTGYRQITKKADASTQQAVEQRANWLKTINALGQ